MNTRTLVTAVLILTVTHYAAFQAGQSELYYKLAATPVEQAQSKAKPRGVYGVNQVLHFTPSRVEFGTVPDGELQKRVVTFVNPGSKEVSIQRVKASCSCTNARLITGSDIPPGGQGQLEITFNPALSSPEFSVSVSVSYDDRQEIDRLLVSGKVERGTVPSP